MDEKYQELMVGGGKHRVREACDAAFYKKNNKDLKNWGRWLIRVKNPYKYKFDK